MKTSRAELIRREWARLERRYGPPSVWRSPCISVLIHPAPFQIFTLAGMLSPTEIEKLDFCVANAKLGPVEYTVVECEGLIVHLTPHLEEDGEG